MPSTVYSCAAVDVFFKPSNERAIAVSAASSVLRDVAMFIRAWFAPPRPYVLPALSATFAFFAVLLRLN